MYATGNPILKRFGSYDSETFSGIPERFAARRMGVGAPPVPAMRCGVSGLFGSFSGNLLADLGTGALIDFIKTGKFKLPDTNAVKAWVGKAIPAGGAALNTIFPGLGVVGQAFVGKILPPGTLMQSEDQAQFLGLLAQAETLPDGTIMVYQNWGVKGSDVKKIRDHIDNVLPTYNASQLATRLDPNGDYKTSTVANETKNPNPIMREFAKIVTQATRNEVAKRAGGGNTGGGGNTQQQTILPNDPMKLESTGVVYTAEQIARNGAILGTAFVIHQPTNTRATVTTLRAVLGIQPGSADPPFMPPVAPVPPVSPAPPVNQAGMGGGLAVAAAVAVGLYLLSEK